MKSITNKLARFQQTNASNLENLLNVQTGNATAGQLLVFDGTNWVNKTDLDYYDEFIQVNTPIVSEYRKIYYLFANITIPNTLKKGQKIKYIFRGNLNPVSLDLSNCTVFHVNKRIDFGFLTAEPYAECMLELICVDNIQRYFNIEKLTGRFYSNTLGEWITYTQPILDDNQDVILTNPQLNDILRYDGDYWVNTPLGNSFVLSFNGRTGAVLPQNSDYSIGQITGSSVLANSSNLNISGISDKQLLSYDLASSKWINASYQIYKNYVLLSNGQSITAVQNTYYDCEGNNNITLPFSYEWNFRVFINTGDSGSQITVNILAGTRINKINGPITLNSSSGFIEFVNIGQGHYYIVSQAPTWFYSGTPLITTQTNLANNFDFQVSGPVNGQVLKYNGSKWINSSDSGLTSVGLSMPSIFSVSNSPLTNNGTLSVSFNAQTQHKFLAGDLSNNGTVVFRDIDLTDIPTITNAKLQNSSFSISNSTNLLTFSASTVNLGSTLTITNNSANQNSFYAGPDGLVGSPTFRSIVKNDLLINNLIQNTVYINANVNPAVANTYYNFIFGGTITLNPLQVGQYIKVTADSNGATINLTGGSFILNWSGSGGSMNPTVVLNNATIELTCISISPQIYYNITSIIQHRDTSTATINGTKISAINNLENIPNVSLTGLANGDILSYNTSLNGGLGGWNNINPSRCLPTAEIYILGDGTTATKTLTTQNVWYIFNNATNFVGNPSGASVFSSPSNCALKYTGASGKYFHTAVSISSSSSNAARNYQIALFRNSVLEPGTIFSLDYASNNVITSSAFHKVMQLNTNDTIEVKIRDISGGGTIITYNNINFVAMACCN